MNVSDDSDEIRGQNSYHMVRQVTSAHCHQGGEQERLDKRARTKLIIASILCVLFMTAEVVGGVLANSIAIATDAAHMLTDFASFMISLGAIYIASRPPTKSMSFGWYRAEVVGAVLSVLFIWVVTGILLYMAVLRVIEEEYEINALVMVITAAASVGFNLLMGVSLHQHGHHHGGSGGHGHSHSKSQAKEEGETTPIVDNGHKTYDDENKKRAERKSENINVRAAFIHVIGDLVQSIGVLTAALIIYFKPEYKIADPICTFLFSVLVLITTISILRDALNVLMEGTPRGLDFNEVKRSLFAIRGIREIHNLRIWALTMDKNALSVHLAIEREADAQNILKEATTTIRDRFHVHDVTVQIESYTEDMDDCKDCKDPKD